MIKVNQETYAILFKHLLKEPMTAHELVALTGIHTNTAQSLMRCLKKHSVVHICGWEKDTMGRDATPIYAFGKGTNKPRTRVSARERTQRYRARRQALDFQNILFKAVA